MGSGSATPPQPPGLTADEKNLLEKQGITLDKFNQILTQGTIDSQETQNLLRNLSGLYKQVTTPGRTIPGQTTYKDTIDTDMISQALARKSSQARSSSGTDVNGRFMTWEQLNQASRDLNVAKQFGLTKPIGTSTAEQVVPESTAYQLDPAAVEDLKKRLAVETASQNEINDLAMARQKRALEGTGPASVGLLQRKVQDFTLLKEAAARRGILIDGDTPETATSQSSAGNELVGQFKRTYGLLEDTERRGDLANPLPVNSTVGSTVNLATQNPTTGLLSGYSQLANSYSGLMQPYTNQRNQGYQSALYGYGQGRQAQAGLSGLLGTGAGIAAMAGGPWGYGIAAGLGGLGLLNSL